MLQLVSWIVVYALILLVISRLVQPFRTRRSFKILFFPGMFIASVVQAVAARLTVGNSYQVSPFAHGRPAFELEGRNPPCLAGTLFFLLVHAGLYLVYLSAFGLGTFTLAQAHAVTLPDIFPERIVQGVFQLDFRNYLAGLRSLLHWTLQHPLHPLIPLLGLYCAAGVFAALHLSRREALWALLLVVILGAIGAVLEWFGVGFPFWSRGWWARSSFFPDCWARFSLYVTLAGLTLLLFILPSLVARVRAGVKAALAQRENDSP